MTRECTKGNINNMSVLDVPHFNEYVFFMLCGRQKLYERLTKQGGEITRRDGYHDEVLLLFKFIFVSTSYSAFSFCAIEKMWRE
jgi:hypothetical protein